MGVHLEGGHWAHVAHQRKDAHMLLTQCSEDLVNIEEAVKQGQLLREAFVCGKPCAKDEL